MKKLIILLIFFISINSQIKKNRLREFTKIDISLDAETKISFGNEHKFEIDGREEDLDRIEYSIRNGTLYIEMEGSRSWKWYKSRQKDRVTVRITLVKIEDLDVSGTGSVMLAILDQDEINIDVSGTVDLETGGRVDYLTLDKSGAGSVYLKKLLSRRVNIDKSGAGSMDISGNAERLKIDCSGASSLQFKDFVVDILEADMSGANSLRITVNDEVSADLSGACSIKFSGDASIVYKDTSGASSVKRLRN